MTLMMQQKKPVVRKRVRAVEGALVQARDATTGAPIPNAFVGLDEHMELMPGGVEVVWNSNLQRAVLRGELVIVEE